jgi:signal transduction histidine kinase
VSALTLWQRLSLLFAALLLACFGAAAWLQMNQSLHYGQQVEQQLLRHLASHVATDLTAGLAADANASLPTVLQAVVRRLVATSPGVEVYVVDATGGIEARYPQASPLQRQGVDPRPIEDFLANEPAPVLGDDPLSSRGRKVFSAAVLTRPGADPGYVYAVLQGSAYDMVAATAGRAGVVQVALWSIGLITPLGLLAGLVAFRQVTRPIVQLTREVQALERAAASQQPTHERDSGAPAKIVRDEIAILRVAFEHLAGANARQWQRLNQQDQQRREWVANISHDLRTPLASMQGYLETVLMQSAALSLAEREQYLRAALAQSQRLSRLAQELLELAHLELGTVKPTLERFSLVELVQDVVQKLALSASARQQRLVPLFESGSLDVVADIGMIERVITNLLDNAIRHTPPGGEIAVRMQAQGDHVRVEVADRGPGIPVDLRPLLFTHAVAQRPGREGGGLGLAIVRQILQLHGSDITLSDGPSGGAVFVFLLPTQT